MKRMDFQNFDEVRGLARRYLPRFLFDYIDRGTEAETALAATRRAFDRRRIVQRSLRDASAVDLSVALLGRHRPHPLIIAPTALAGLVRHDGEVKSARAAGAAGLPYCVATQASTSIERIAEQASGAEIWFQLYPWKDRAATFALMDRARRVGVEVLVVTVDTPTLPKKVHNLRNGFSVPLRPSLTLGLDMLRHPGWTTNVMGRYLLNGGIPSYANYPGGVRTSVARAVTDPRYALATDFGPGTLSTIRDHWPGKLIIKGIMHPDDATAAINLGADGIVVSSHGGRNFDSLSIPLDVLPGIRTAVGGRAAIIADSCIRKGSDIAKLIGAGADAVMCGRMFLWGLAANGATGVEDGAKLVVEELRAFLMFSGMPDLPSLRHAQWVD